MKKNNRKLGFSLAETLLTMTVLGVVAALCVPSLKSHSDEQQLVALARKAYATATHATEQLEAQYGDARFWDWGAGANNNERSANSGNINKLYKGIMGGMSQDESWSTPLLDGTSWGVGPAWWRTADNMVWYVYGYQNAQGSFGVILVDTNGKSAPNRVGCDVLGFVVNDSGVFPLNDGTNDINQTWGCVSYAIQHGKMPWLRDTSMTSCPKSNK